MCLHCPYEDSGKGRTSVSDVHDVYSCEVLGTRRWGLPYGSTRHFIALSRRMCGSRYYEGWQLPILKFSLISCAIVLACVDIALLHTDSKRGGTTYYLSALLSRS